MKKVRFSTAKRAVRGKGFLIALLLCFSAVGVSTYIAYNGAIDKLMGGNEHESTTVPDEYTFTQDNEQVGKNQEDIPVDGSAQDKIDADPQDTQAEDANSYFAGTAPKLLPIEDAEVINPFSNGELVYSETLCVWKTHDGIDLKAAEGTDVLSMTAGKVTAVTDDPLWGVCVTIDHKDGIIGYYANLAPDLSVKVDQEVEPGTVIGKVGSTADIESKLDSHLHFGVKKNDVWINPLDIID